MKKCKNCGANKPLNEYGANSRRPDGLEHECKQCRHVKINARNSDPVRRQQRREKSVEWFRKNREKVGQQRRDVYKRDPERFKARAKAYRQRNPHKKHAAAIKSQYGLTLEAFNDLLASQNGVCAICSKPPSGRRKRLCVDHDHGTGAVRGLLCQTCNRALGLLNDDIQVLMKAVAYLQGNQAFLKFSYAA